MQKALIESKLQDQQEKLGFMAEQQENRSSNQPEMVAQEPAQAQQPASPTACPATTSAADTAVNSMPVIAQMNSMMINTGGPNIIGN